MCCIDCACVVAVEPFSANEEDDTSAFDMAVVAVEPNVTDDGDIVGTVDIEDPGEVELELVLRCR